MSSMLALTETAVFAFICEHRELSEQNQIKVTKYHQSSTKSHPLIVPY